MLKGDAKKLYQREYMKTYMRRLRLGLKTSMKDGIESYQVVDKTCGMCGHVGIYEVHHVDRNHNNNQPSNLLILCPNCHAEVHRRNKPVKTLLRPTIDADGNVIYDYS